MVFICFIYYSFFLDIHQITRITDIIGSPAPEDINMLASERAREFLYQMGQKPKIPWSSIIPNCNPLGKLFFY